MSEKKRNQKWDIFDPILYYFYSTVMATSTVIHTLNIIYQKKKFISLDFCVYDVFGEMKAETESD